ncbi:tetratricopeptide repeat protein [Candidatus Riflebacteria bacterium]
MPPKKTYFSDGLQDESLGLFEEILITDPINYQAVLSLMSIYISKKFFDDAVKVFKTYYDNLAGRGLKREIIFKGAFAYLKDGDLEEAKIYFRKVLDTGARWADCFYNIALCHFLDGDIAEARNYLAQSLEINPNYLDAQYLQVEIWLKEGDKDNAIKQLKKMVAGLRDKLEQLQNPFDYDISVHFQDKVRLKELIAQLKSYTNRYPHFADYHFKLGLALEANEEIQESLVCYENAIRINSKYARARERFWQRGTGKKGRGK